MQVRRRERTLPSANDEERVLRLCSANDEEFVRIPAEAFPSMQSQSRCLIVLEVRNLVNPKNDTLVCLIKDMCPRLNAEPVEGDRAYARVRIFQDDEALVRSVIKTIAKKLGKKPSDVGCTELVDLRLFESPRD